MRSVGASLDEIQVGHGTPSVSLFQCTPNTQLTFRASSSFEVGASLFLLLDGEPVSDGV